MASVDQRKYLKKYLDEEHTKDRKKKRREHPRSHSERVKIVDDDGDYRQARNYDDDNDYMLTGEDAPQIVGIIDDRPPELKAAEDFRNNSKWKSLPNSGDRSSRVESRFEGSIPRQRRSRSPVKRDYSPPRRTDRRDAAASSSSVAAAGKKRRPSEDYSPVRRRGGDGGESKQREANYYKSEKGTVHSDGDYARRREDYGRPARTNDYGNTRDSNYSNKDVHSYQRPPPSNYVKQQPYSPPMAQRSQPESRRQGYPGENGRSADYHPRESYQRSEYVRYSRDDQSKSNPFRANPSPTRPPHSSSMSQRNEYSRKVSPMRSGNPFRSNPRPVTLSPLPDRRGGGAGGGGSGGGTLPSESRRGYVHPQKPIIEVRHRVDDHSMKSNFRRNMNPSHMDNVDRKAFNPFRGDKSREQLPAPIARTSGFVSAHRNAHTEMPQPSYRSAPERSGPQRSSHHSGFDKKDENVSYEHRSYRRSRSPIKSSIQIVNPQPTSRTEKSSSVRYQTERRDPNATRFAEASYPAQNRYYSRENSRKQSPGQISTIKY